MKWSKDLNIPFTNGDKWIEIEIDGCYFDFSFREMYVVAEENRRLLGATDDRTVFGIYFRIPFVK